MQFSEETYPDGYIIRAYEKQRLKINDTWYENSLVVSETQLIEHCLPNTIQEMTIEHCQKILTLQPGIVLLGTGERLQFPANEILQCFQQQHVGIEVMDTPAAARTYNILLSEGRNVLAALIIG